MLHRVPDEPHFPAPEEKAREPYREPERPAPAEASRKIVTRAEPPPSSSSSPKRAAITREEMNAMIAVTAAQQPRWKKSLWRSPALIVVTIVGHLLDSAVGIYSIPISMVLAMLALAWIARPLFRRDGFS